MRLVCRGSRYGLRPPSTTVSVLSSRKSAPKTTCQQLRSKTRTWVDLSLRPWTTRLGVHQQLDAIEPMLSRARGIQQAPAEPTAPITVPEHFSGDWKLFSASSRHGGLGWCVDKGPSALVGGGGAGSGRPLELPRLPCTDGSIRPCDTNPDDAAL
jgi:hypothetical protein